MDEPLNLVLFSGTDDKLQAAAVLTAGAAALGKPVNVFLQYWALDAFRADRIGARPRPRARGRRRRPRRGRRADAHGRPGELGRHPPPGQGARRRRHPGLLAVDGPAALEAGRPRSARRRGRRRDRLLPQRRRRPGRLHLIRPVRKERSHDSLEISQRVDARGLSCPMPIVKTAQAVKTVAVGRADRGPRDRSGVRQGLRGLGAHDRQRARRAVSDGGVYRFVLRRK